ncbi:MAG: MBL fold metallo-hydrolase [Myxococcales bacterium]|jgi:glyoxylase-like metal-dependent hydrolase (beta-lactamase superfamily II)
MEIRHFYDPDTYTLTYVVYEPASRDAVIIDPVLDYDPKASQTSTRSVDAVAQFVEHEKLNVHYVLETHAHADHLSGSQILRQRFDAHVVIGAKIKTVQETFRDLFDLGDGLPTDGSQFDRLAEEGEALEAGSLKVDVIETPGHTPACVTYKIDDAVFTGDALFMPDYGVGRCDFPRGSAEDLYHSVHDKLYALPDDTRVFVGHDYQPDGRAMRYETTIGASRRENVQLKADTGKDEFVSARTARDETLEAPRLLLPSVQVNANAGRMPPRRANGRRYLSIPINLFHPSDDVGRPE